MLLHVICDLTIAADTARLGQVGPKVGSVDPVRDVVSRTRSGEKKAREIWFLCRQYSAEEAFEMKLVNKVVPKAELDDEVAPRCAELRERSPTALAIAKQSFNADTEHIGGLAAMGMQALALYYETDEAKEGVRAAEGRQARVRRVHEDVLRVDFALTEEQRDYQERARRLAVERLAPEYQAREQRRLVEPELRRDIGAMGLIAPEVSEDLGGRGLDRLTGGILTEAIARGDFNVAYLQVVGSLVGQILSGYAKPDVAAEWVPKICSGEEIVGIRPVGAAGRLGRGDAASACSARNLAAMSSTGSKSLSFCSQAAAMVVFARTSAEEVRAKGISAFLVSLDGRGSGGELFEDMGTAAVGRGFAHFDDVWVPREQPAGRRGRGVLPGDAGLRLQPRPDRAAVPGAAQVSVEETWEYVSQREAFDQPLSSVPGRLVSARGGRDAAGRRAPALLSHAVAEGQRAAAHGGGGDVEMVGPEGVHRRHPELPSPPRAVRLQERPPDPAALARHAGPADRGDGTAQIMKPSSLASASAAPWRPGGRLLGAREGIEGGRRTRSCAHAGPSRADERPLLRLLEELQRALSEAEDSREVAAVVLRGEGRAFCAGADIDELRRASRSEAAAYIRRIQGACARLEALRRPVLAAVHGVVFGGGLELALACDLVVAEVQTRFGLPEVKLGLIQVGEARSASRLVGRNRAKELVFFGEPIHADTALELGIVNRVVPEGEAFSAALGWAAKLSTRPPLALGVAKRSWTKGSRPTLVPGWSSRPRGLPRCSARVPSAEGMSAFLEKRTANFTGE